MPRRRRMLKIGLAISALTLLAVGGFVAATFMTFGRAWDRPTDFADQMVALSRERQKLGPQEIGGVVKFIDVLAAMRQAHEEVAGRPLRVERGEYVYDYTLVSDDSAYEAQRAAIMAALESRGFFAAFDDLAADPRILPGIVIASVDTDARWNDAEFKFMREILTAHAIEALKQGDADAAVDDVRRLLLLAKIMMVQPDSMTINLGRAVMSRAFVVAHRVAKNDAATDAQRAELIAAIESARFPSVEQMVEDSRLWLLGTVANTMKPSIWMPDDRDSQLAHADRHMQEALEAVRSTDSLKQLLERPVGKASVVDRVRLRLAFLPNESLHLDAGLYTAMLYSKEGVIAQIAIERYRRGHDGQLPPSLDALIPKCLPRPLVDPLNPHGFVYRVVDGEDGPDYLLYSKGIDGVDNNMKPRRSGVRAFSPEASGTDVDLRIKYSK